jgi:hypothetical protein
MPKNIEDIIVPERKRSIRDVPIPAGRHKFDRNETPPVSVDSVNKEKHSFQNLSSAHFDTVVKEYGSIHEKGRMKWAASGVALLVLTFAIFSIFQGATLAYIPKSQAIVFNGDVFTTRQTGEGGLLYSVVKLSRTKGVEVAASGGGKVERKASGTIIIYNTNTQEQKLRATTRFETPDGKIYQIADTLTIPGKTLLGGIESPGTVEVVVQSASPGAQFNTGLTDFTIPGLKGTSLFVSVYARSKTEMSGGFVGQEKSVKDQDGIEAKTQLDKALREELLAEAQAQVPVDFIMLPTLSTVTFRDLLQTDAASADHVMLNRGADLLGIMFKRSDLTRYLASDKMKLASGESVDLDGMDVLNFDLADKLATASSTAGMISFKVTGESRAIWQIDEVALKADLVGRHKKDIPSILNNYPNILSATTTIRPFWKSSFPSNGKNIDLKKLPIN